MDRLRKTLYEASIIFLSGIVIACIAVLLWNATHALTIENFKKQYPKGATPEQEVLADQYLKVFTAAELMQAVEEQNADGLCHVAGHAVGRSLYKADPNFTEGIRQCGSTCTFGCFHGVMLEMFDTESDTLGGVIEGESPEAVLTQVKSLAKDLCTKPEVLSVVQIRTCYHGLGHVFASMENNDLDRGLDGCDIFPDPRVKSACVTGVFMEYLFSASSTDAITKDEKPCDAYPEFMRECFIYKAYGWVAAWGGVQPAMKACDSFGEDRRLCIRNVSRAAATEKMMATVAGFDELCGSLDGDDYKECVSGAFLKIIYLNSGDDSDHACDPVALPYRKYCVELLHKYRAENI